MATELDGAVTLRGLRKSFGERIVVDDVSLEIRAGEFFSLLGPSGCGKMGNHRAHKVVGDGARRRWCSR